MATAHARTTSNVVEGGTVMEDRSRRWLADLAGYLAVAFGVAWLVATPLWTSGQGLASPLLGPIASAMMLAPSLGVLAVLVAARVRRRRTPEPPAPVGVRPRVRVATGLTLGPDRRRTLRLVLLAWLGTPVLVLVSGALSVAVGVLDVDPRLGLVRESVPGALLRLPGGAGTALAVVVLLSVVVSTAVTLPFALGEEWGWRGWLQPHLVERWGIARGLVATGVIWGLWHAPLTLLGYNYPTLGRWAALYFVPFTVLAAVLLGWLRIACGSVWPAVVGHASINSTAVLVLLVAPADPPPNPALAGLAGVVGWVVLAFAVLALTRRVQLPREPEGQPTATLRSTSRDVFEPVRSTTESRSPNSFGG